MYSIRTLLSSSALAFIALASLAVADQTIVEYEGFNITITEGTYRASDPLSTRANVPPECSFAGRTGDYSYRQFTGDQVKGTACFGWDNFPICSTQLPWNGQNGKDIETAMKELVKMDGWLSSYTAGNWIAIFETTTTAFKNRDTGLFFLGMFTSMKQPGTMYWSRDGDYANVSTRNGRCP